MSRCSTQDVTATVLPRHARQWHCVPPMPDIPRAADHGTTSVPASFPDGYAARRCTDCPAWPRHRDYAEGNSHYILLTVRGFLLGGCAMGRCRAGLVALPAVVGSAIVAAVIAAMIAAGQPVLAAGAPAGAPPGKRIVLR